MKMRLDDRVAIVTQRAQERVYGRTIKFGNNPGKVIEYGQIIMPYELYEKNRDELRKLRFKITHIHTTPMGDKDERESYEFEVYIETRTLIRNITDGIDDDHVSRYNRDLANEIGEVVGVDGERLNDFSNKYVSKVNKLNNKMKHPVEISNDGAIIDSAINANVIKDLPRSITIRCNLTSDEL